MLDELQKETVLSMILDPLEEIFGRLMRTRLMQIEITEMIQKKKSYYKHHMEIQDLLRFFWYFQFRKQIACIWREIQNIIFLSLTLISKLP